MNNLEGKVKYLKW